ncbi:MAG: hypothetical protein C0622_05200 [Desulfuromonas sp.]|nr:MAG: hypothetical protein C0622_05200 [Desulfuromonas sp.]
MSQKQLKCVVTIIGEPGEKAASIKITFDPVLRTDEHNSPWKDSGALGFVNEVLAAIAVAQEKRKSAVMSKAATADYINGLLDHSKCLYELAQEARDCFVAGNVGGALRALTAAKVSAELVGLQHRLAVEGLSKI